VFERTGCLLVANPATHAYLLDKLKDVPMKNAAPRKSVA
jgi:myo-inositol-1(or 4)-monophosphatase